ncbi:NAD(P)-dependent oxidoreductase [Mycobacterium heckeshornense]|uniref:Short-chain dehydrogenase n=1 Tax=Mycobacterium heckeshornense TaxID=110505 RepID=A0A2G8B5Y0_9MYCO|nr:SDR family oxidoreductase [Mycobacterium heckeshornense]MCV7033969.1 SDR family oxidoreductase [Mycobacterium heckeshornense]PIJ33134.1 NAD(P)-dependent oxidoreductase [Mycobacterium heckeshornense]BCO37224.1 short-chain dehydrogenase [Mycobacterium heckeshornense]
MTGRLDGRSAIVTGASRGLGRAIALALAAEGAAVAVVGRTEQVWDQRLPGTIGETVADIEAAGGRAVAVRADLLNRDDIASLVSESREALGPITILVNNAAFTAPGRPLKPGDVARHQSASPSAKPDWPPFLGTPVGAFRRHFEIAVFAAYELMQLVCPDMLAAGHGSIINITSVASRLPGEGPYPDRSGGVLPGYGGSKAALEHLTQCAAFELQGRHIAVNALSPSKPILTPGLAYYAREFDEVAPAEEFARAAVQLALVNPDEVTGRTIGHLQVLDGSFRPYRHTRPGLTRSPRVGRDPRAGVPQDGGRG